MKLFIISLALIALGVAVNAAPGKNGVSLSIDFSGFNFQITTTVIDLGKTQTITSDATDAITTRRFSNSTHARIQCIQKVCMQIDIKFLCKHFITRWLNFRSFDDDFEQSRFARQAPPTSPEDASKQPSRVARQAPPSPPEQPKRVARDIKEIADAEESSKPLQIRQDAFYSTVMKISHWKS